MPLILGTNSIKDTGFDVANSLRFNSGSSEKLTITPGTAGNRRLWTWSSWIKRSSHSGIGGTTGETLFHCYDGSSSTRGLIQFQSHDHVPADTIKFDTGGSNSYGSIYTAAVIRDLSAWVHIVCVLDTANSTATDRQIIYVNGVRLSVTVSNQVGQNYDGLINTTNEHEISSHGGGSYFDGYMAETVFIDGQALAPTSFGEFDSDTGIWKPIKVSGLTFGDEGFYLEFKGTGTSANSSGMGADTSGNNNHFAVTNLTAVDQSTDTCTNNFATWNPLSAYNSTTASSLSNGSLKSSGDGSDGGIPSTIGFSQGKWYWEIKYTDEAGGDPVLGIINSAGQSKMQNANGGSVTSGSGVWCIFNLTSGDPGIQENGAYTSSNISAAFSDGDIGMFAVDPDAQKIWYGKNGTWYNSGNPATGANATSTNLTANETWFAYVEKRNTSSVSEANFGSPPFAISSGNTDGDGFGNFEYAVPSGYFALCTKNLAEHG